MFRDAFVAVAVIAGLVACGGTNTPDASSSGSGVCTTIGCVDGLTVRFDPATTWKHGKYVFSLEADGVTQTCTGTLPLPPCGPTGGLSCTADIATIGESGCALPPAQHGFADIHFRSGPSKVAIRIERDGVSLANATLAPAYQTVQPNGPSCGPICRQASASIALTEP